VVVIEFSQVGQRLDNDGGAGSRDRCVCHNEATQVLTQPTAVLCNTQLYYSFVCDGRPSEVELQQVGARQAYLTQQLQTRNTRKLSTTELSYYRCLDYLLVLHQIQKFCSFSIAVRLSSLLRRARMDQTVPVPE